MIVKYYQTIIKLTSLLLFFNVRSGLPYPKPIYFYFSLLPQIWFCIVTKYSYFVANNN